MFVLWEDSGDFPGELGCVCSPEVVNVFLWGLNTLAWLLKLDLDLVLDQPASCSWYLARAPPRRAS